MNEPAPTRGGAAAMLLLFSVVVCALGLGLDFGLTSGRAFWIGAEHGMPALIALGAVIAVVGFGRLLRVALGREEKGAGRGGDQP